VSVSPRRGRQFGLRAAVRIIPGTTMNTRTRFACLLALVLAFAPACSSTRPPASPVTQGGWDRPPVFDTSRIASPRIHVASEDPARSNVGPRLVRALTDALATKGYETVTSPTDADFLCVLVVRYLGRTAPPDGYLELLAAAAGDPILGGDESWLAPDGSGYDTVTRKSKTIRVRSRARGWFGELFKGHEDDEWVMVVDVAIGARQPEQRTVVQRHEGRAWAASVDYELAKPAATQLLLEELKTLLPAGFP
jgi:hypothetical protein